MPDRMPPLDTSRRTLEPLLGYIRLYARILRVDPEREIAAYLEADNYAELVRFKDRLKARVKALKDRKFLWRKKNG